MKTRKQRELELSKRLHDLRDNHDMKAVREMLDLMVEDVKDALLVCDQTAFARLQGQAEACNKLRRYFERHHAIPTGKE